MLVENLSQILHNISMLFTYKDTAQNQFFKDLIKKGKCFVLLKENGQFIFAPSRFVGYIENDIEKHLKNSGKHGGDTNIAIRRILGREEINESVEGLFLTFCKENEITPDNKSRRYWVVSVSLKEEQLINDLMELGAILPKTTRENLSLARIGQGKFRVSLIDFWGGCALSGCKAINLLRASHIKPWKDSDNEERLDVYNGLLLMPNYDSLFDKGIITFDVDGEIVISSLISRQDLKAFGVKENMTIQIQESHQKYLDFHREYVFQK
nr:HNH endonuclease [Paenibacillus xylanexedens]